MNPFLEILDSLIESFSAILGRPRAAKPTRAEEQERPADLPGSEPEPPTVEEPAEVQPVEAVEATEPEITAVEAETPAEVDDERPVDLPPAEEEPPAETVEEPIEPEPIAEITEAPTEEAEPTEEPLQATSEPYPLPEPVERKVLLIHFDPLVPSAKGRRLSDALAGRDPEDLLRVFISDLRECSGGYARYRVIERVNIDRLPVKSDGFQYSPDHYMQCWQAGSGFHMPDSMDYAKIFEEADIYKKVNEGVVDEIWMFGPPYCGFYESVMAGKGAFYLNAPALNLPEKLERRVVVMGFNYERGEGEMLESYGHRAEDIMKPVFQEKSGNSNLWERFTRNDRANPGKAEVGSIHYAPNSERDYDWGNPREVMSRCDTWLSFPDLSGAGKMVKGEDWGDGDMRAHHKWWFTRIPHVAGVNEDIDLNWWKYIVDPNEVK
jgi:hypothetical protein